MLSIRCLKFTYPTFRFIIILVVYLMSALLERQKDEVNKVTKYFLVYYLNIFELAIKITIPSFSWTIEC
jgi:surface polysaccharide O-acyltransferase-like enzyme